MDTNAIDIQTRQPVSAGSAGDDRLHEVLELEHEISELRHTISVMAVELVGYRERYG